MSASISAPIRPRSVESIFLNMVPLSRAVAAFTRRAASPASRERDSVSIARTRALGAGAGHTVTGTAPPPANSAPVSQAPVRSSATIVSGNGAAGLIGGPTIEDLAVPCLSRSSGLPSALHTVRGALASSARTRGNAVRRYRWFVATLLTLLAVVPTAAGVVAQPRVARVGFLEGASLEPSLWQAARDGLRELGYVEGQNLIIEYRSAQGQFDRVPELLSELIRLKVDVILTIGDPVVSAAKQATSTIPIVMAGAGDPVGRGFVASLARPGGNITGISNLAVALTGKWFELAKEVVPRVSRVAMLRNAGNPTHALFWAEAQAAGPGLGLTPHSVEVRGPSEFEHAFASMVQERVGAVVVLADPMLGAHRARLAELSAKHRLPSISPFREAAEYGGLLSYGPSLRANFRRAATYIDRILKGARAADLPVEQPTKFELVVNVKTARALGLTIPPSLLLRADQVIE